MASEYLYIYSGDRDQGSPEEFSVNFQNDTFFNVAGVKLESAIIPNTTYNVESGFNSLVVRELATNGVDVLTELSTTIAAGNYTSTTFKSAMNTALSSVFDGTSGKGTFTLSSYNSANGIWSWSYTAGTGAGFIQLRFSTDNTRDLSRLSGFGDPRAIGNYTFPPTSFDSPNHAFFQGINFFRVRAQPFRLQCYNSRNGRKSDVLAIIPASNYLEVTEYNSDGGDSDMIELAYPSTVNKLFIRLEDEQGNRVDLHGAEVHYTFKFYFSEGPYEDNL